MTLSSDPKAELIASIPRLRAYAMALSGNLDRADDLVQQTLVNAWAHIESFEPGSNMAAWLHTILRNEFYSEFRRRRHEVPDGDGLFAARLATMPTQEGHMVFLDFREALDRLAPEHREALVLIGASGLSYEQAAEICGCAIGTMKSRVHRARARLTETLMGDADETFGPDPVWDVAAQPGSLRERLSPGD